MKREYAILSGTAAVCPHCLGGDRRLWVGECCAGEEAEPLGPDPQEFPPDVLAWVKTRVNAPHESLTDAECIGVVCLRLGYVPEEHLGVVVVLTDMYWKQRPQDAKSGVWVGAVGDKGVCRNRAECVESRLLDPVTLDNNITIQSTLVKFKTVEGEDLTWFASGKFIPEKGAFYDIKFGVKGHDLYEGHRSTLITRCADVNAPKKKRTSDEV